MNSMSRSEEISRAFEDSGISLIGSVVEDGDANRHLVFVSVDIDDAGAQTPTNYAISKVERAVEAELGAVTVVLVRSGDEDIASSIKSVILRRYPNEIRNVFSAVIGDSVSVWVEPKSATNMEKSNDIRRTVADLVGYFHLELLDFVNTAELNLPSETACIGIIRKKAPVNIPDILAELESRGFEVPGDEWISRILDRWRKRKLIHRKANGQFVMTVRGLRALGSGKDRRSPDIGRALDMARRGL